MNMQNVFAHLEPQQVWKYFYEITQIPRPSKHEQKIINYLIRFAQEHGLEYEQDSAGNVVIRKPAYLGYEHKPWVALQSHMDMVCEKHSHVEKDFFNEPIEPYIDGDWVKARGTTLGADNGIGMALQLAILADPSIQAGPIECLFTVDEETGLTGAFALEPHMLRSKILINLDSEDDGEFFIGCAGGKDTIGTMKMQTLVVPADHKFYKIHVSGLQGGHSGDDIHKGRGNANKILIRFLWKHQKTFELKLAYIDGGNLRNAIPREAFAVIALPHQFEQQLLQKIDEYQSILKQELCVTDSGVTITCTATETFPTVMHPETQQKLLNLLYALPHGVIAWSQNIPNFVETSTNLASVKIQDEQIVITTSQRSSLESAKENICNMVAACFELAGAQYQHSDGYPGWNPNPDSRLLNIAKSTWKRLYHSEPVIRAIHAGLECGLFSEKFPGLDMISYGPTMRNVHSPDEMLYIPSVKRFWEFTLELLQAIE